MTPERAERVGLYFLMTLVALCLPGFYLFGQFKQACMALGFELILYWAYLNPWILREKYSLFMYLDTRKMENNRFLVVGLLIFFSAAGAILFHIP